MSTFCLIHGAWHDGSCWAPLIGHLRARGHEAVAPDLPYGDPTAGYAERARPALKMVEGAGERLVVLGHSMGSAYAALVAPQVPGALLVHLCPRLGPFPSPPGAPRMFREGFPFPPTRPDGKSVWDSESAISAMYPRLPAETGRALARRLLPMAPPAGEYPLSGHPDVPTVLVHSTHDELFEPAWERFMARRVLGIEPTAIAGGHFPMIEDPAALADLLDALARHHLASPSTMTDALPAAIVDDLPGVKSGHELDPDHPTRQGSACRRLSCASRHAFGGGVEGTGRYEQPRCMSSTPEKAARSASRSPTTLRT